MATNNFQYHLTFNGKFSNETYIEYFDPNHLDENSKKEKILPFPENRQDEMLKQLKEALNGKGFSEKEREQTAQEIRKILCEDQCKPNSYLCGSQKGSDNLYFQEEYQNAVDIVVEIVDEWLCASDKTDPCQRMKCQWGDLPKNNRILFHGQRGSGKTSVTMSVAKSLEGFGVGYATFKVLPIINPGYFDDDTNILKTIISNMFEMAKCIIKKGDNDSQRNEHETLLKQFEEVYRLLGSIESPNKEKHTLESLNEISKASGMREAMQKLVNQFIKILPCKAKYLVLVIDDVDMSVAYAATMLEQINKFLQLDNLLILISANLDQLHNEMREHYSKAFEKTLNNEDQSLSIDVEDLASKYLLKLFPASRRVNVERPVSKLLQTELIIDNVNKGGLQKAVLSLIWEKTRLLYLPKDVENTLHPVIPTNLRELAQLLNLLDDMDDVEIGQNDKRQKLFADKKSYDNCKKNINTFKNYFFNIWVPTHLAVEEEQVFINIPSDITEINKHLINSINVIGTRNKRRLMSREVGLDIIERNAEDVNIDRDIYTMVSPNDPRFVKANKISDIFNQPSNYSYGDLLLMIDKYETYFESEEDRKFTNAIKIYYSILLFETMFFKSNNIVYNKQGWLDINKEKTTETEKKDIVEKWTDLCKRAIPIQKLIGGTVYYPNYFEIITSNYFKQKGPSFDAKRAFYHKLEVENNNSLGQGYPLFSVLYYGDIRPDRYDTKHIFDTTYNTNADVDGKKFVTFDILSILNNMLNPWHTINRTDNHNVDSRWEESIKTWGRYCAIDNQPDSQLDNSIITTPNSILPFYSVDMMLLILKKQFDDETIIRKANKSNYKTLYENLEELKKIIDCIRDTLYRDSLPSFAVMEEPVTLYKDENTTINIAEKQSKVVLEWILENHKDNKKNKKEYDIKGSFYDNFKNILVPLSHCRSKMITECRKQDIYCCAERMSLPDRFRDCCSSLILSKYVGGVKGRDVLIKGLKKQTTITEMYKYLVDQLWENDATEILIRNNIQKEIRSNEAVEYYYRELLELLTKSVVLDKNQQDIYNSIFDKARMIFIEDKQ